VIPLNTIYPLSQEIYTWAKAHKVRQIISLGGINQKGEQDNVYGIASLPELSQLLERKGIELIKEGATTGVSGILLADCATRNFPAISLLAEAHAEYMDPRGAAMVLEALSRVTSIKVDTTALEKQGKLIEDKMKQLMEQAKGAHEDYQKTSKLGPMYG